MATQFKERVNIFKKQMTLIGLPEETKMQLDNTQVTPYKHRCLTKIFEKPKRTAFHVDKHFNKFPIRYNTSFLKKGLIMFKCVF
jgi:hypothetical protein